MRVVIANRGEVAVRIIRACQELGWTSILLHSTPDKNTAAFRIADETLEIPGSTPLETYLDISKIVDAAKIATAQLLHPGFGFLSENAEFAERLAKSGITFVGPAPESILSAGNKVHAKELAKQAGVPFIPGYTGPETTPEGLLKEAKKIGFPCMIKAASGGGGKGMKVVREEKDFVELLESAQREALNAFGSRSVFIEKFLENPRHIEIQIIGDTQKNLLHFFERDCSIQRRHQKIFEETPAMNLRTELREKIAAAALKIAEAAKYFNAGTVEFLLDSKNKFYFMELNTRLQVEHTVTELVCGVDLVKMQFAIASGKALGLEQSDIQQRGHALEVRVYAENPENQFLPSTGRLEAVVLPLGPHRRFDFGYEAGDTITPFYDPMIGKIITWAPTREENVERMLATLSETVIFGVHTNIEFLKTVLRQKDFVQNKITTSFLEDKFKSGFETDQPTEKQRLEIDDLQKNGIGSHAVRSELGDQSRDQVSGHLYQSPWTSASWGLEK